MNNLKHGLMLMMATGASLTSAYSFADVASSTQQYGSYVILGQNPAGGNVAIARTVIQSNLTCPTVSPVNSQSSPQTATPLSMITRDNPNHFPVIVCEALIAFDQSYQLNFFDQNITLPTAKSNPQHIQVFGDTGCKSSDCATGTAAEPFKSLADSGASDNPDLILHMGDYNYRGTGGELTLTMKNASGQLAQTPQWPYDAGDSLSQASHCGQSPTSAYYSQSAVNSNRPDSWQNWQDDLFMASQDLMLAAPWVVVRGNHELCSRAGPGYFYFLDPHSNLVPGQQQLSCPAVDMTKSVMTNTVQIANYIVSFDSLDIAVIDSANACDSFTDTPFQQRYNQVFSDLNSQMSNSKNDTWLITHRPIWGVQEFDASESVYCSDAKQYSCINQMMQKAIAKQPAGSLPDEVKLVLTGHMHKFESVSFSQGNNPPSLIVGSSGVELSGSEPAPSAQVKINGQTSSVLTTNTQVSKNNVTYDAFGYMNIQFDGSGQWQGQLVNPGAKLTLANCSSKANLAQGICELASGVMVVAE
ncbi:MAG: hypothetical protein ACI8WB_000481 [Phenylobacterium sp.]|jgi:hypothetical protein